MDEPIISFSDNRQGMWRLQGTAINPLKKARYF